MRSAPILLAALLGAAPLAGAVDEVIVTADSLPARGMSQSSVLDAYGTPTEKRAPVGGGSQQQPPITRWDYAGFVVIFEHGHVVDTVRKDEPAPIKIRDGLSPATP